MSKIRHTLNPLVHNSNEAITDKINELCHAVRQLQEIPEVKPLVYIVYISYPYEGGYIYGIYDNPKDAKKRVIQLNNGASINAVEINKSMDLDI